MHDVLFACALATAFSLIAYGAGTFSTGAGFIIGGILLAVWSALVFGEVNR